MFIFSIKLKLRNIKNRIYLGVEYISRSTTLGLVFKETQQASTGGLEALGTTPKLKIYNQATLPQKIQYWLLVALSIGSLISYGATVLSSIGFVTPQCNCTAASTALPK